MQAFLRRNLSIQTWRGRVERMYLRERVLYPLLAGIKGKELVYYMHINKAGGTSVLEAMKRLGVESPTSFVVLMPHQFGLKKIPWGAKVACIIRRPETRFASGFEHMYRKGYPSYQVEWTEEEAAIFQRFRTFDQLVDATLSSEGTAQEAAQYAWRHIFHLKLSYAHYFGDVEYLRSQRHRIVFVGEVETMEADWERMFSRFYGKAVPMQRQNALQSQRSVEGRVSEAIARIYPEEEALYRELLRIKAELNERPS
jgi:hypothetical protein